MSLLEVILAMAILAGAVAALGELIRVGIDHARSARLLTEAQLLCESKLAELTSGIEPVQAISMVPINSAVVDLEAENELISESPWVCSIELATVDQQTGVVAVRVTVSQDPQQFIRPVSFSLVRWMPDTGIDIPMEEETEQTDSSSTSNTQTGSTSGSASSGSSNQ